MLFTAHQHAREHLTVEMALYLLREFTDGLRHRLPDHQHGQQPRDLDRPGPQPRRRRVRHRHRLLPRRGARTGSPTPVPRTSAPTSTATGTTSGAAAAARRGSHVLGDLPRHVGRVRARGEGGRRLRAQPGRRRRSSRSRPAIDFHTYSELVLWPFGYTYADTAHRHDRRTTRNAFATVGQQDGRHQRLHARAVQRPLHHRRLDRRLAVGQPEDLRLHLRDVPGAPAPAAASTRPTRSSSARPPATGTRCCSCWRTRTACTGRSARRRSTASDEDSRPA